MLYALVLAIGRDRLPGAEQRFELPQFELPAAPLRLEAVPGIETSQVPAVDSGLNDRVTVPIHVQNVSKALSNDTAGIATFHSLTGSNFRWLPLNEAMRSDDGTLLVTSDAQSGSRLTVTLAHNREHARHGYVSRQEIDVLAPNGRTTQIVTMQGTVHDVQFKLPSNVDYTGPMRLRRIDDQQWLPMLHNTSGLTLRRGQTTILQLGAGSYELQDPLAPGRSQQFTVSDSTVVDVTESLAPARDDRP